MMNREEIRVDAMSEILSELNISLTTEQIKQIVNDFTYHLEMEREMDSYQYIGHKEECAECKMLRSKLNEIQKDIEAYQNSVKIRRNATSVWLENGEVKYSK